MSKARLVITALSSTTRPGRGRRRATGCSRPGSTSSRPATEPRARPRSSRAPGARSRSPTATPPATVELVLRLRKQLADAGLDAGADTIAWHLAHHHATTLSRATINRILARAGAVTPEPSKRPKSLLHPVRGRACPTRPGSPTSPTTGSPAPTAPRRRRRDPHLARRLLPLRPARHRPPPGHRPDRAGHLPRSRCPARDPGLHADRQRHGLHHPPRRRHAADATASSTSSAACDIVQKNSRPNHPTTCGKVERFQQTMKKWLRAQPVQPATIAELQTLLDAFADAVQPPPTAPLPAPPGHPGDALHRTAQSHSRPSRPTTDTHDRVRHDTIDKAGTRHPARRTADCTTSASAEPTPEPASSCSSRTSTSASSTPPPANSSATSPSTPARDYQPTGRPPGPHPQMTTARTCKSQVRAVADVLRHHMVRADRI